MGLDYRSEQRLMAFFLVFGGACFGAALLLQGIAKVLEDTGAVLR